MAGTDGLTPARRDRRSLRFGGAATANMRAKGPTFASIPGAASLEAQTHITEVLANRESHGAHTT